VISSSLVGLLAAFDLVSFPFAVVLVAAVGIVWEVVFDRRRRWWSEEPSLADDPIGRNASRNIVWFAGAAVVVVVLLAFQVLSA
jgi:heme/copper-type cytochrome/quinol oxidase subunit 2